MKTETEKFSISRASLCAGLRTLLTNSEDELGDIMGLAINAWAADTKAGNVESAAYNDLIATQCAYALKLKAMLKTS